MTELTTDTDFDAALIGGAFNVAVLRGWNQVTVAAAAREAGLDLARARTRAPGTGVLLLRFGQMLDASALRAMDAGGTPREKLFDMLMGRFDALQAHRDGVLALFAALPYRPATGLMLLSATRASMEWLVDAADLDVSGLRRAAVVRGMVGVWLFALRAWEKDESPDMTGTLAAVDKALDRATALSRQLCLTRAPELPDAGTAAEANMDAAAQVNPEPGESAEQAAEAFRDVPEPPEA